MMVSGPVEYPSGRIMQYSKLLVSFLPNPRFGWAESPWQAPDLAVGPAGLGAAVAKMPWPLALRLLEEVAKFGALEALEALEALKDGEINSLGALKYGYPLMN